MHVDITVVHIRTKPFFDIQRLQFECPFRVNSGCLQHPQKRSAPGGKADEIGGKADIAILNVRCWGVSRRSDGMSMTSVHSHKQTFAGALEVQNEAVGWRSLLARSESLRAIPPSRLAECQKPTNDSV